MWYLHGSTCCGYVADSASVVVHVLPSQITTDIPVVKKAIADTLPSMKTVRSGNMRELSEIDQRKYSQRPMLLGALFCLAPAVGSHSLAKRSRDTDLIIKLSAGFRRGVRRRPLPAYHLMGRMEPKHCQARFARFRVAVPLPAAPLRAWT